MRLVASLVTRELGAAPPMPVRLLPELLDLPASVAADAIARQLRVELLDLLGALSPYAARRGAGSRSAALAS